MVANRKKLKSQNRIKVSNENNYDDLVEIIAEDENEIPIIEPTNALHNSYDLFYKRLPVTIVRNANIRQNQIRDYYKKTFESQLPQPIIQLNSKTDRQSSNLSSNEIEEAFQHDLEHNFETMDANDDEQNNSFDRLISNDDNDDFDENFNAEFDQLHIENDNNTQQPVV